MWNNDMLADSNDRVECNCKKNRKKCSSREDFRVRLMKVLFPFSFIGCATGSLNLDNAIFKLEKSLSFKV